MSWPATFDLSRINLQTDRVDAADGVRQLASVREILKRLEHQPGVVLADEVGMGKTFVALGVAVATALSDKGKRPVVVMVPASLRDKWPRDWKVFCNLCLTEAADRNIRVATAPTALAFFKLLDDAPAKRARIIFLSHGAFHAGLDDPWVKLAIIKKALHGIHLGAKRDVLPTFLADLIRTRSTFRDPDLFVQLLRKDHADWLRIINEHTHRKDDELNDDPIPEALSKVLSRADLDLTDLRECLRKLPQRETATLGARLTEARQGLNKAIRAIWPQALSDARFRSPLLILDEAHHLKNPATRLASLFVAPEAEGDRHLIDGALEGGFERMLFLTATPFQLGHDELLNVIDRFKGIDWKGLPETAHAQFKAAHKLLKDRLDEAQRAAADFDWKWRHVRKDDVVHDDWWSDLTADGQTRTPRLDQVVTAYARTREAMKSAEEVLRPWVLRHLRPRTLPSSQVHRRVRLVGSALRSGQSADAGGLPIADGAVLPFLLAARSQAVVARTAARQPGAQHRATFADGLASSYEAFLETRRGDATGNLVDEEHETQAAVADDLRLDRYLKRLRHALPSPAEYSQHPKMAALIHRVVDLWAAGEKVVVFCHYRMTGRAIVRHLSAAVDDRLWGDVASRLGCDRDQAKEKVRLAGQAFDEGRLPRVLADHVDRLLADSGLADEARSDVHDVVRRFVRTPLFLGRYLDLADPDREHALHEALVAQDGEGIHLQDRLRDFVRFIAHRCEEGERKEYLDALKRIHPGLRGERPIDGEEDEAKDLLLPTIRLANGAVHPDTRRNLLLAFNTPFFPEILVASSVMAEGVDLHLNCRHLIHYDLSWNPSTIEQRTGRVDRLGAKAERVQKAINVFMPFVAGTQDEKMFRVVTDRERWFQVLMGENYRTDEASTDRLAERVALPESVAAELAFRLEAGG